MPFVEENFDLPKKPGHYAKLEEGENRFRILSETPLRGFVDWRDKKPIRFPENAPPEASVDPAKPYKYFWAMIVWNYTLRQIQILEIVQRSILEKLHDLVTDVDWQDPREYDIRISKKGSGMETRYALTPGKHAPMASEILEHARATKVDIGELLTGGDPFAAETPVAHSWWQDLAKMPVATTPAPLPAAATEAPETLEGIQQEYTNDLPF